MPVPNLNSACILDLGTGSGCIAITLALELPGVAVTAVDTSADALEVARGNASTLGATVDFIEGDLYDALPDARTFDVIVANAPYIPTAELAGLQREVRREPALALDGGPAGLDIVTRVVRGAPQRLRRGGTLLAEMHESHGPPLEALLREVGFADVKVHRDLAGLPRFVEGSWTR